MGSISNLLGSEELKSARQNDSLAIKASSFHQHGCKARDAKGNSLGYQIATSRHARLTLEQKGILEHEYQKESVWDTQKINSLAGLLQLRHS